MFIAVSRSKGGCRVTRQHFHNSAVRILGDRAARIEQQRLREGRETPLFPLFLSLFRCSSSLPRVYSTPPFFGFPPFFFSRALLRLALSRGPSCSFLLLLLPSPFLPDRERGTKGERSRDRYGVSVSVDLLLPARRIDASQSTNAVGSPRLPR